ncbi:MAG TPA: hypothetical protein VH797_00385 [Nitrososphaeraceae archaeon]
MSLRRAFSRIRIVRKRKYEKAGKETGEVTEENGAADNSIT